MSGIRTTNRCCAISQITLPDKPNSFFGDTRKKSCTVIGKEWVTEKLRKENLHRLLVRRIKQIGRFVPGGGVKEWGGGDINYSEVMGAERALHRKMLIAVSSQRRLMDTSPHLPPLLPLQPLAKLPPSPQQ